MIGVVVPFPGAAKWKNVAAPLEAAGIPGVDYITTSNPIRDRRCASRWGRTPRLSQVHRLMANPQVIPPGAGPACDAEGHR
jgi:hypothetical protein